MTLPVIEVDTLRVEGNDFLALFQRRKIKMKGDVSENDCRRDRKEMTLQSNVVFGEDCRSSGSRRLENEEESAKRVSHFIVIILFPVHVSQQFCVHETVHSMEHPRRACLSSLSIIYSSQSHQF